MKKHDHMQLPGSVLLRRRGSGEYGRPSSRFDASIDHIGSPAAGAVVFRHPFQLLDASIRGESPAARIKVREGTLNGMVPTDVGTAIALEDGTYRLYLDVEINLAGTVVAVTLLAGAGAQPPDTDYHGFVTLGEADALSGKVTEIRQAVQHSLGFQVCGRVISDGVLISRGSYEFWGL